MTALPVVQSGAVTPNHVPRWITDGVMADGGPGGSWRGNWASTTQYFFLDFITDPATLNIYVATTTYLSDASLANDVAAGNLTLAISITAIVNNILTALTPINSQVGTTYTLQVADNGAIIVISNSGAITVTLPATLPAGFNCLIEQEGAGQITMSAAAGATLHSAGGATKTTGQYASVYLFVFTNSNGSNAAWRINGNITA